MILTSAGSKLSDIKRWLPLFVHSETFGECLGSRFAKTSDYSHLLALPALAFGAF